MEKLGWLQGSLVKQEDVLELLNIIGDKKLITESHNIALIVASGSCDVANLSDPVVEFSIARYIDMVNGNFNFNKNPRKLHCDLESSRVLNYSIELNAHEKVAILKDLIPQGILPDPSMKFSQNELSYYVEWLAARYKRPAFPSEFDSRIDIVWKKEKRRKAAAKVSEKLIGIYANVFPDAEIPSDKYYHVDLLAIVVPNLDPEGDDSKAIQKHMDQYKEILKKANMKVGDVRTLTEKDISVSRFKQYKRFNFDDLSYKSNHPLPPELTMP